MKTTFQNVWDAAKAVLREKLTTIQADLKKKIPNLILHLKELEKNKQNPK